MATTRYLNITARIQFALRHHCVPLADIMKIQKQMLKVDPLVERLPPREFGMEARVAMGVVYS